MSLYITKNGQQLGPFTVAQVQAMLAAGTLQTTDLAWYEGQADWIPLSRVPGLAVSPALAPARRPVMVWIICLLYFIFMPIGLVTVAAMPYLIPFSLSMQHRVEESIQAQIDRAPNEETRERLAPLLQRVKDGEARTALQANHGPVFYAIAVVTSFLGLAAAIYLFMLRRLALYFFIAAFSISLLHTIYTFVFENPFRGMSAPMQVGAAIGAAISWMLTIAIVAYVGYLFKRGVLR